MTLPDLALIHGWGLGNAAWEAALPALRSRFRVHLLSLPGYSPEDCLDQGTSHNIAGRVDSFTRAADALAASLPDGCLLCGWSLGGMLALHIALRAPQRLKGLILVGTTPCFTQHTDWPCAQPPALLDTFSEAIAKDAKTTLQRFVALLNQGDDQARAIGRAMAKALAAALVPDIATLLSGLDWLRDVDLRNEVAHIATPTLLIHGKNDPLMPIEAAHWLNQHLPNSQLETFAGAAHAPFQNNPERFAKLIGDYCHAPAIDQATRP